MTTHEDPHVQHPVTQNIPLPGNYPCLTLQLNITRYASGGLGRLVCVLRDPGENLEIGRWFRDTDDWEAVVGQARYSLQQGIDNMRWLQMGVND